MPRLTWGDAAIFLLPALLVMLVITLYPFVYTVVLSFHNWNLAAFQPPRFVGLDNYLAFFNDPDVWRALRVTALYVLGCRRCRTGAGDRDRFPVRCRVPR